MLLDPANYIYWLEDMSIKPEFQFTTAYHSKAMKNLAMCRCWQYEATRNLVNSASDAERALMQRWILMRCDGCVHKDRIYVARRLCAGTDHMRFLPVLIHELFHWFAHDNYNEHYRQLKDINEGLTELLTQSVVDCYPVYFDEVDHVRDKWASLTYDQVARAYLFGDVQILKDGGVEDMEF